MPIDNAQLDQYITDLAGEDQDLAKILRERLGTNQQAATRFVNGYLGKSDVTRKQQEVSEQRKHYETLQQNYEQRLIQADQEKDQIMKDLADARISESRAQALLRTVREAYGLSNKEMPGIEDIKATAATGTVVDSTPDIEEKLKKFEERMFKRINDQLIPEMSALAQIPSIWKAIWSEHEQLYGKPLTEREQAEILADARKNSKSLKDAWQEKFGISEKRLEYRDTENRSKWRQEWDDEQAKRNQELAMRGVRPESGEYTFEDQQSPVFRRSFAPKPEPEAEAAPGRDATPAHSDAARERMSGADRAAARFMERARNGQLGKPLEPAQRKSA